MRHHRLPGIALGLLLSTASFAAAAADSHLAIANAVQPPVWLERGGARMPLSAGTTLKAGDQFITGAGGRLHIAMADDSMVKLGENAQLELPRLELKPPQEEGAESIFSGALKVLRGAFRYTTLALGKTRRREIDVSIGPTITAGIRGTDIWGKSDDEKELLCLIEGKIEVSSPGAEPQTMDQAATFYVVPRDKPADPVAPVPEGNLEKWAPQTELKADEPALSASGGYMVGVESSIDPDDAQATVRSLGEQGYAAEIVRATVGGRTWYRVVISGLSTRAEATRFAKVLRQRLNVKSPWVMAPPRM